MPIGLLYQHRYNNEDFNQAKVYKLVSNKTEKIYIGSTTLSLSTRLSIHKHQALHCSKPCSSKVLFENGAEVKIELLQEFGCETRKQMKVLEACLMAGYGDLCCNKNSAIGKTPDQMKYYYREYNRKNKDIRKFKHYISSICDVCNGFYNKYQVENHCRTFKHLKKLEETNNL